MQLPNYFLWVLALSTFIHSKASPAPFKSARNSNPSPTLIDIPKVLHEGDVLLLANTASWVPNQSPNSDGVINSSPTYKLPPVSYVFEVLAFANPLPPLSLPAPSPPQPSPSTAIPPLTATMHTIAEAESTGLKIHEPGLVVPTRAINDEPASMTPSAGVAHNKVPAPTHKLVVIASVMGGLILLTFCTFIIMDRRVLGSCWRRNRSPCEERAKFGLIEKEEGPYTPNLNYSTSSLSIRSPTSKIVAILPPEDKVIDIVSDFPRSKFSVTSSDYPFSIGSSSTRSSGSTPAPTGDPPLLSLYQFFCMPSMSDVQDHQHSRAHSAPIFSHTRAAHDVPAVKIRSGDHRKSKSVSGLVYVVEPGSNEWKGNPQSGILFHTP